MKVAIVLCACIAVALAAELSAKPQTRTIPADVLRDFPDVCFASTLCRTFKEGENWDLKPFCGKSSCVRSAEGRLMEQVQDCGPLPKPNPKCKISEKTNVTAEYPLCCPKFDCEDGVELEFDVPAAAAPPS